MSERRSGDSTASQGGSYAITSASNPTLKSLAQLRRREEREARGKALVHGARESRRALEAGVGIEQVLVAPALLRTPLAGDVFEALAAAGLPIVTLSEAAYERIRYGDRSDGIVVVIRTPTVALEDLDPPGQPLIVVLEGVEKAGNVGAVLRSADGAGADALIVADGGTDLWNPNAIRASMGAIFSVPLAAASSLDTVAWLRKRGIRMVAARVDADGLYTATNLRRPVAIVLGSETTGLTSAWQGPGVEAVRIPMLGRGDSLNVSVAAALLLYEARRQRGLPMSQ